MGFNDYSSRILRPLTGDTPWVPRTPWLTLRRVHTCILVIPQARDGTPSPGHPVHSGEAAPWTSPYLHLDLLGVQTLKEQLHPSFPVVRRPLQLGELKPPEHTL